MLSNDLLFHLFPNFLLYGMAQKVSVLTKYNFQQVSFPYQKKITVQSG